MSSNIGGWSLEPTVALVSARGATQSMQSRSTSRPRPRSPGQWRRERVPHRARRASAPVPAPS